SMVKILTEPKNALIKQYQRMFELDGVELEFEPAAIRAIAVQALERGTGARGLRAILEAVLQGSMLEVPGSGDAARVILPETVVLERVTPSIVVREHQEPEQKSA